MASHIASIVFPFLFMIQTPTNIQLNGKLAENEWKGAKEYQINSDYKVLMSQEKDVVYAALISTKKIWAHVYLSDGETVHIMHASAALDDVKYKKEESGWLTEDLSMGFS